MAPPKGFKHSMASREKISKANRVRYHTEIIDGKKRCTGCNKILELTNFGKARSQCIKCREDVMQEYKHRKGLTRPLHECKDIPAYLGVHIAERVLSGFFEDVKRMPYGNPGFDFICKRGNKIDVKSSCLILRNDGGKYWKFMIKKNQITDYFLCIAFDNRESLTPLHVWLVPSKNVSSQHAFHITDSEMSLKRWSDFEKPLDRVLSQCDGLRGVEHA
jgi:hypothetical protein